MKDRGSYDSSDNYSLDLRIGLGYTWHDLETIRSILFPSFSDNLKADYRAGTFQIFGITYNTGLDELYSASFCKLPRIIVLGVMSATCLPNHHSHLTILLAKTKSMSVKCFFDDTDDGFMQNIFYQNEQGSPQFLHFYVIM